VLANPPTEIHPREAWHGEVGEDNIGRRRFGPLEGLLTVAHHLQVEPLAFEGKLNDFLDGDAVVSQ